MLDIASAISSAKIVALKTQNGFKLVVDAANDTLVKELRSRKHRPNKPFALMALNISSIEQYAYINDKEKSEVTSDKRPIVILKSKQSPAISTSVACGIDSLGFMLPSSPLEYMIFQELLGKSSGSEWLTECNDIVLIVTSANISGDSIIADNDEAIEKLSSIADMIVTDNRRIAIKSDDSVVQVISDETYMIRRSRGFVPTPIELGENLPSVFATGTYLKNTFTLTNKSQAYVSQYIGDMGSQDNIDYYHNVLEHFKTLYDFSPEAVVCDMHPDIYTAEFAQKLNLPVYEIQHHEAHLAAVVAEHNLTGKTIGLVLDGFGLGEDGLARGGELYMCNIDNLEFKRKGNLVPIPYVGGDSVSKNPWRMALALGNYYGIEVSEHIKSIKGATQLTNMFVNNQTELPVTTSMGRVFDAVSSLLGVCHINTYEAEAAIRLESLVDKVSY